MVLLSLQFWVGVLIGFALGVLLLGVLNPASAAGDAMDNFYKDNGRG